MLIRMLYYTCIWDRRERLSMQYSSLVYVFPWSEGLFSWSWIHSPLNVYTFPGKRPYWGRLPSNSLWCSVVSPSRTVSLWKSPPEPRLPNPGSSQQPWGPDPMSEASCRYQSSPQSMSACIIREVDPAILLGKTTSSPPPPPCHTAPRSPAACLPACLPYTA